MPEGQVSWLVLLYTETKKLGQIASVWHLEKKENRNSFTWARQLEGLCSISPHLKTSEKKNTITN